MKNRFNNLSFRRGCAICLMITALLFNSCDKNDDDSPQDPVSQLPPATMTGENTFGYLLDREPIKVSNTRGQVAIYQGGLLQIAGEIDTTEEDFGVNIVLQNPLQINTPYDLTNFPTHRATFKKRVNDQNCGYNFEDTYQGSITLTKIDQVNYIVSGHFNFSTSNQSCGNINITEGRFDLQYIP